MERWSVQQCIFCVEQFVLSKSIVSMQRDFCRKFGDDRQRGAAPSRKIIGQWVRQWRETGSVQVKARTRRNTIWSPENIQRVRIALERSPHRSVWRHSHLLNLSDRFLQQILHHDSHFHPYKLQIVQELAAAHKALRFHYCQQMVHMHADPRRFLIMSGEAIFSLSGYVNKQNCRYWVPTNPRQLHEWPIHSPQVVVLCAISAQGIIGPYFFEGDDGVSVTVNAERYNHMLETFFLPEMRRRNCNMARVWFQQDGATAHTARLSMNTLRASFPGQLLSQFGDIQWPSISPDVTAADFFMGVFESSSLYTHPP
jgi:hypothetical protein